MHFSSKQVEQQAEAISDILISTKNTKFIPIKKTITIKAPDQPWVNSYTNLLMKEKNRNYGIFMKVNSGLLSVISNLGFSEKLVTRLKEKKSRASQKARSSAIA